MSAFWLGQSCHTFLVFLFLLSASLANAFAVERRYSSRLLHTFGSPLCSPKLHGSSDDDSTSSRSSSVDFAMDPASPQAVKIVREHFGLSLEQHQQLAALAALVVDWNSRINLISRKDCTKEVVFGRHILPSLAPLGMLSDEDQVGSTLPRSNNYGNKDSEDETFRVVDVGTGGGFPGLPLAIAYPNIDFLLVDSVGKKLMAVQDMADRLGLTNVQTYHGRAEAIVLPNSEKESGDATDTGFDVCVGRSVAAIPTYCFWIQNLLKKDTGRLMYMIGGDIEEEIVEETLVDLEIERLLECPGASDKRILVFSQTSVARIAASSGEKIRVPLQKKAMTRRQKHKQHQRSNKRSKGEWTRKDNNAPKQRGYENFQRFDSLNP